MKYLTSFLMLSLLLVACSGSNQASELDLLKHGMPIKINASQDAVVVSDDLGFMKDITVKDGSDYFIQILSSSAINLDAEKIKADKLAEVKNGPFFSKIIQEDANGFIFEKQIDANNTNYDFRHIRIQGDKEYIFQTGLIGTFSLEAVKKMYLSVQ